MAAKVKWLCRWLSSAFFSISLCCLVPALPAAAARPLGRPGVTVCSDYPQTIYVAFAYQRGAHWVSVGWYTVESHGCVDAELQLTSGTAVYFRAETNPFIAANGRRVWAAWGNDREFCENNENSDPQFYFPDAGGFCGPGGHFAPFNKLFDRIEATGDYWPDLILKFTQTGTTQMSLKP